METEKSEYRILCTKCEYSQMSDLSCWEVIQVQLKQFANMREVGIDSVLSASK